MTSHPLEGVSRIIAVTSTSVGIGNTDALLRPDAGKLWEVVWAAGTQDDGAVVCGWYMTDPDASDFTICGITATAAWKALHLGADIESSGSDLAAPLVLTHDRYCTFRFAASAAAKHGYIRALVKEYRGVSTEA